MTIAATSFFGFGDMFGRKRKTKTSKLRPDLMDPAPLARDQVNAMLLKEAARKARPPLPEMEALRRSEKLEQDTMDVIRGALYPAD